MSSIASHVSATLAIASSRSNCPKDRCQPAKATRSPPCSTRWQQKTRTRTARSPASVQPQLASIWKFRRRQRSPHAYAQPPTTTGGRRNASDNDATASAITVIIRPRPPTPSSNSARRQPTPQAMRPRRPAPRRQGQKAAAATSTAGRLNALLAATGHSAAQCRGSSEKVPPIRPVARTCRPKATSEPSSQSLPQPQSRLLNRRRGEGRAGRRPFS